MRVLHQPARLPIEAGWCGWADRGVPMWLLGRRRGLKLLSLVLLALMSAGCGGSGGGGRSNSTGQRSPSAAIAPPTPKERLVSEGARLAVTEDCAVCHLSHTTPRLGPSFYAFAGHHVELTDGRVAFVDEQFLERALEHPGMYTIRGYDANLMVNVLERLGVHLAGHPHDIAALAAFIEQVGPEA